MMNSLPATAPSGRPSGPPRLPLVGNAMAMLKDPLQYFIGVRQRYGSVASLHAGPTRLVMVQSPAGVRQILWEKGDQYPKPALGMSTLSPLLGQGIATLVDRAKWEEARSFILPLFSARMLKAYFEEAVISIGREVEALDAAAADEQPINVYDWMHKAAFRVLIRTVFRSGIAESETAHLTELFNEVTGYISVRYLTLGLPITWAIPAARRGKRALEVLNRRVYQLIRERRSAGVSEAGDMLDVLLQARLADGSPLTDEQIRDNCMTMLFGGHETTAGSLTWAWGLLAANPAKRNRMLAEIDAALGGQSPAALEDLRKLGYCEQVFEEAMRLYPMFALLFRQADADDVIEGRQIAKGDLVAFSAFTVHRDPTVWPEPEAFQPERHSAEGKSARAKGAFLSFSQGQRGCIGERMARMEGVLMLSMISQRYTLDLVGGLPKPKVSMSLKPKGGMWMTVRRRKMEAANVAG